MDTNLSKFISLLDLGIAYRKAKADLFYSPRTCRTILSAYESKLSQKLKALRRKLIEGKTPPVSAQDWTLVPKRIKDIEPKTDVISSDPQQLWESIFTNAEKESRKVKVEFRLMERLPVDFHVFASLWINKVGHKFEEKLTESAKGNRLRRGKNGKINILSLGSTVPYLHAYKQWRDNAFVAMEEALSHDKSVVAITADVSSFYHKLDVRFMCHNSFIERIGVVLNNDEKAINSLFINALDKWAKYTPLGRGLPVGLSASSIIANVALYELDRLFECETAPLYYGRYVDDIILVMENRFGFKNSIDVWDWLIKRMNKALSWKDENEKKYLQYSQPYLDGSEIIFSNSKNKTFLLSGVSGHSVLKSIWYEVQSRTSEWRSLPNLPDNGIQLKSMLLAAIQRDGTSTDSLRKADNVSVRRAGFALKLRDVEAYSRALPPQAWRTQRHAFLEAFIRHVLVMPTFFDFFNYLSRILMLTVSCADFTHLRQMLDALEKILHQLEDCENVINAKKKLEGQALERFRENLKTLIQESIECAFPLKMNRGSKILWNEQFRETHDLYVERPIRDIQVQHQRYLKRDLAYCPLKLCLLPPSLYGQTRSPIARKKLGNTEISTIHDLLEDVIITGCKIVVRLAKLPSTGKMPSGLLFPIRPLGTHDLYLLHSNPFSRTGSEEIEACLLSLRGFKAESKLPIYRNGKLGQPIEIPYGRQSHNRIHIAVTSWKTNIESWTASVSRHPDPDNSRLYRITHLLNSVIRSRERIDYIILPELSIPANWFLAISHKLQGMGISLICGIEYLHSTKNTVHNQVWAALSHDALGFPTTMIYRQDKQHPALHEELELNRIGNKVLRPQLKTWKSPPVINHGGFQFALLVCSELTNIDYRSALRGKVDALFVPEWNQDTESFVALVESAALDVHSYIIQCNDRQYGDSRIRVPHKNNWMRDIVRVKGGIEDYFVIGEIDIQALRAFQSSHHSPQKPFKPVPDGFEMKMAYDRKVLPTGSAND